MSPEQARGEPPNQPPAALEASARAERSLALILDPPTRQWLTVVVGLLDGVAHSRAGNIDSAKGRLEIIKRTYDRASPYHAWWYEALEGELALKIGDVERATAAFSAGEPQLKMYFSLGTPKLTTLSNNLIFRDGLARVKEARGDFGGAIEVFRKLLTPDISSKWTALLEPRYVLELARLLERSGDRAGAREQYRRFADLWQHADQGLPELTEARRKLSVVQ